MLLSWSPQNLQTHPPEDRPGSRTRCTSSCSLQAAGSSGRCPAAPALPCPRAPAPGQRCTCVRHPPKPALRTEGPAGQRYCRSDHYLLLDVKNCIIVLQVLLLSSKVDKADISYVRKDISFPQGICYLYLLNTKAINNKQFNANRRYL